MINLNKQKKIFLNILKFNESAMQMHLYFPKGHNTADLKPAVVYIHGVLGAQERTIPTGTGTL